MPGPVRRPKPPKDITTSEEVYLTGLRLEQLHSPSFEAAPYYEEVLRRDPGDYRANTALGILLCQAWRWAEAEDHLRAAIARATENYIRPKDGEAFFYLGVALKARDKLDAACDSFQQATWSPAWQPAAYLELAEIDSRRGNYSQALEWVTRSLAAGSFNTGARVLKCALLRKLDRVDEAEEQARGTLAFDPLDFRAGNELYLAQRPKATPAAASQTLAHLTRLMRGDAQSYLELATDYGAAGLWTEAMDVLQRFLGGESATKEANPLVYYHLGYCAEMAGSIQSLKHYQLAAKMPPDYCFPYRFEEERILRRALEWNPEDARAWYYLGNLLFDRQPEPAIEAWEKSRQGNESFALVHRNLGLAYAQTRRDPAKAIISLEKAVTLNPREPRFFYELDVQYEAAGVPLAQRLNTLTNHHEVVAQRDDALTREIVLLLAAGQTDQALELLTTRHFHNWEGRSEIHGLYADALLQRGHARRQKKQYAEALKDYAAALEYPLNLEVGRPYRDRKEAQVCFFIGLAHEGLGDTANAKEAFEKAILRKETSPSEIQYYQGLCLQKLGRTDEARQVFESLVRHAESQLAANEQPDYFAKFAERQSERVRQAQAHYLLGLGHAGLGHTGEAQASFDKALGLHPAHLGALMPPTTTTP